MLRNARVGSHRKMDDLRMRCSSSDRQDRRGCSKDKEDTTGHRQKYFSTMALSFLAGGRRGELR